MIAIMLPPVAKERRDTEQAVECFKPPPPSPPPTTTLSNLKSPRQRIRLYTSRSQERGVQKRAVVSPTTASAAFSMSNPKQLDNSELVEERREDMQLTKPVNASHPKLLPQSGRQSDTTRYVQGSALELEGPLPEKQKRRERIRMVNRLSTPLWLPHEREEMLKGVALAQKSTAPKESLIEKEDEPTEGMTETEADAEAGSIDEILPESFPEPAALLQMPDAASEKVTEVQEAPVTTKVQQLNPRRGSAPIVRPALKETAAVNRRGSDPIMQMRTFEQASTVTRIRITGDTKITPAGPKCRHESRQSAAFKPGQRITLDERVRRTITELRRPSPEGYAKMLSEYVARSGRCEKVMVKTVTATISVPTTCQQSPAM